MICPTKRLLRLESNTTQHTHTHLHAVHVHDDDVDDVIRKRVMSVDRARVVVDILLQRIVREKGAMLRCSSYLHGAE